MSHVPVFKALADPGRLRALAALQHRELCVCQIVELLCLAPSTVSKHMSVLARAGLVGSVKRGKWVYYHLARRPEPLTAGLLALLAEHGTGSTDTTGDAARLEKILALDPEELCRLQAQGGSCVGC